MTQSPSPVRWNLDAWLCTLEDWRSLSEPLAPFLERLANHTAFSQPFASRRSGVSGTEYNRPSSAKPDGPLSGFSSVSPGTLANGHYSTRLCKACCRLRNNNSTKLPKYSGRSRRYRVDYQVIR